MSWFNINVNESLNTIKGQISNVSHVVHDVFNEGILETPTETDKQNSSVDDDSILAGLEAANYKIDELTELCHSKDNEV